MLSFKQPGQIKTEETGGMADTHSKAVIAVVVGQGRHGLLRQDLLQIGRGGGGLVRVLRDGREGGRLRDKDVVVLGRGKTLLLVPVVESLLLDLVGDADAAVALRRGSG